MEEKKEKTTKNKSLTGKMPIKLTPRTKRLAIMFVIVLLLIASFFYFFKNILIAAIVNGKPITRISVIKELEKQGGKQTLETLITKALIVQEAEKKGISVTNDEVEKELKKIESQLEQQGQTLEGVLLLQGLTREAVAEETRIQLILKKMIEGKVKVTDKDVDSYLEENKENLPEDLSQDELKKMAKDDLSNQKMNVALQDLLKELKDKANISYFVDYK